MTGSPILSDTGDERAALGCAVLDAKCAALVLARLSADDFSDADLAAAFDELRRAYAEYGRADIALVGSLAHRDALLRCAEQTPSLSGCEAYIRHVKDKAVRRRAAVIGLEIAAGSLTAEEIAARAGEIARLTAGRGQSKSHKLPEMLVDFMMTHKKGERPEYIETGLGLDGRVRLLPGDYMVIGARPSAGKTAYSIQLAINLARGGRKVLYFSLETGWRKLVERIVACAGSYSFADVQDNAIDWRTVREARALEILAKFPIDVNDGVTSPAVMEAMAVAGGYDAVIVDYLGLMNAGRSGASLYERTTEISLALHRMAQKNRILVVALCQLNRSGAGEPKLEHLRESGQIEQDADVVILLHDGKEEYRSIVAKNKTGKCGGVPLWYDKEKQHFTVIEKRRAEP